MKKTNSLTSHNPESNSHRADKMSGNGKYFNREWYRNSSKRHFKKFANSKRRQLLKQNIEDKI